MQGCIILIKSGSKDFYNIKKDFDWNSLEFSIHHTIMIKNIMVSTKILQMQLWWAFNITREHSKNMKKRPYQPQTLETCTDTVLLDKLFWNRQCGSLSSVASQLHFRAILLFFMLLRFTLGLFFLHHFSERIKNYKAREIIWMWIK